MIVFSLDKFPQRKLGIFLFSNVTNESEPQVDLVRQTYDTTIICMTFAPLISIARIR